MNKIIPLKPQYERSCEGCTACCRGYLTTTVNGELVNASNPCRHVTPTTCIIYEQRPQDPCRSYSCLWLKDKNIPVWMKPSECHVIISFKELDGIQYIELTETTQSMDPSVLNWFFLRLLEGSIINLRYQIHKSWNYAGSRQFVEKFNQLADTIRLP